jgi:hypothetical protein
VQVISLSTRMEPIASGRSSADQQYGEDRVDWQMT